MSNILLLEDVHKQVSSLIHELCANIYGSNSDNNNNTGSLCKECVFRHVTNFRQEILELRYQMMQENDDEEIAVNFCEDVWSSFALLDADVLGNADDAYFVSRVNRCLARANTFLVEFYEYVLTRQLQKEGWYHEYL